MTRRHHLLHCRRYRRHPPVVVRFLLLQKVRRLPLLLLLNSRLRLNWQDHIRRTMTVVVMHTAGITKRYGAKFYAINDVLSYSSVYFCVTRHYFLYNNNFGAILLVLWNLLRSHSSKNLFFFVFGIVLFRLHFVLCHSSLLAFQASRALEPRPYSKRRFTGPWPPATVLHSSSSKCHRCPSQALECSHGTASEPRFTCS